MCQFQIQNSGVHRVRTVPEKCRNFCNKACWFQICQILKLRSTNCPDCAGKMPEFRSNECNFRYAVYHNTQVRTMLQIFKKFRSKMCRFQIQNSGIHRVRTVPEKCRNFRNKACWFQICRILKLQSTNCLDCAEKMPEFHSNECNFRYAVYQHSGLVYFWYIFFCIHILWKIRHLKPRNAESVACWKF